MNGEKISTLQNGRWLIWLPSAVLLSVAVMQCGLVTKRGLVSWKGGGFGMFSSIDTPSSRRFSFHGKDVKGESYLLNVAFSEPLDLYLRCYPNEVAIRSLASELVTGNWVPDGKPFTEFLDRVETESLGPGICPPTETVPRILRQQDHQDGSVFIKSSIRLTRVQVQLWRVALDASGGTIVWQAVGPAIEVDRES